MREVWQAQKRWDQTIVNQRLCALDSANACYDRKEMSEEKIGGMVLPVMIIGPADVELQKMPQAKKFAKRLKKAQSTEACQTRLLE